MRVSDHVQGRWNLAWKGYITALGKLLGWRRRGGELVTERDWDNLLVLDACRYDVFREVNDLPGDLDRMRSVATETPAWLKRNFGDGCDAVYVAGNPYVAQLADEGYFDAEAAFHHVEHVWDEGWDEEAGTVRPGTINAAVRDVRERFPDRRIVAHYMQPHEPFIGETQVDVDEEGWGAVWAEWHHPDLPGAYRDNLELVLDAVEDLLPELDGTTVVTGDHGEILDGKYGLIRHPKDVFVRDLYEVPWFVVAPDYM